MKPTAIALAAALAAAAPVALAGGGSFQDTARVKDVDPEYERVNVPRKECYSEYVPESRYERNGGKRLVGPLIGGVAGGLLGSQIGKGNGKVAAAAAGAAIGAIVGDRLSERHAGGDEYYEREVRRCRMVDNWESRIVGYRVTYEYQGHLYTTVLPYDPGPRMPVQVSVAPVEDRLAYHEGRRDEDDWD
ncbi:MAG TPA: glycine zipper 2TM domain-containing protein [Burkholderiales bacterium]|nr:glycine zipper 2TM domain-containing protein [Burkholderiales bacterium]